MPKGHTNNPNGRPIGATSKRTKEWEALGEAIATKHAQRFNNILDDLDPEKFTDRFLQVLEYFQPKLARTELRGGVEVAQVKQLTDSELDAQLDKLQGNTNDAE